MPTKKFKAQRSPWRLLMITALAIFLAEIAAMLVVPVLQPASYAWVILADAGLITILTFPVLYFLSFRPLLQQIEAARQIGDSLLRSRELQERFFDSIDTLIAYMDRDFNFIRVNAAYARSSGQSAEALIGRNHFALYPHEENRAIFGRVVQTGQAYVALEKPFEYPDQPERGVTYWNWSLQPVRGPEGSIEGAVLSLADVTERRRAEQKLQAAYDELELRVQQRTEQLRASEERYRTLFNSMTEGFALHEILCDEAGVPCDYRFLEVNPSFERLTGLTPQSMIGRTVKEVLPVIEPFWIEAYGRVAQSGKPAHLERFVPGLDRYYDVYAYCPTRGQFATVFLDITERKRWEAALQRQNEELEAARAAADSEKRRLEAVMEALPVGVAITNAQGGSVRTNQAYEQLWGQPRPDVHSIRDYAAFHAWWSDSGKAIRPEEWASVQVIEKGMPVIGQLLEIERFDGTHAFVLNSAAPVREASGAVIESAVAIQDVTELRRAEQALRAARDELELRVAERTKELADANHELTVEINERREMEKRLRVQTTAVESAANGIIITGRRGNIRWANPAFLTMTGYSLEEVLGRSPRFLRSGQHDAAFYRSLWETILAGRVWRGEIVNRRKDGSLYVEEQTITPLVDPSGEISNFIAIKQDITERKQAEAELERRNAELQALGAAEKKQRQMAEALRVSAQALTRTLDLDAVIQTLLRHARSLVQSDKASVILVENESLLTVHAAEGWSDGGQTLPFTINAENNPFYRQLVEARRSLLIHDTAREPAWPAYPGTEGVPSWLFAPILIADKVIGILALGKTSAAYFSEEHVRWAEGLTGQAAIAIQNAWLFEQVRAGRERLQSLSRRLVEIQETERRFIARELHDQAGQTLTSLILELGALEKEADVPPQMRARCEALKGMTDTVLEDLHRLAIDLRPATLDHLGLVPALEQLVKSLGQSAALTIRFKTVAFGEDDRLPEDVETALYRIAQEALTNVVRHAGARRVDVVLERRGGAVLILVEDDGRGFDLEPASGGGHLGLVGMAERAEMLGGALTVESIPGRGTTLVAEVPYGDPDRAGR